MTIVGPWYEYDQGGGMTMELQAHGILSQLVKTHTHTHTHVHMHA